MGGHSSAHESVGARRGPPSPLPTTHSPTHLDGDDGVLGTHGLVLCAQLLGGLLEGAIVVGSLEVEVVLAVPVELCGWKKGGKGRQGGGLLGQRLEHQAYLPSL